MIMMGMDHNLSEEQLIIGRLVSIEDRLERMEEKLLEHIKSNDECINALRQDVKPVIEFYDRVETVGIMGRAIVILIGTLLAMAAAIATVIRVVKNVP